MTHRTSYWKTTALAFLFGVTSLLAEIWIGTLSLSAFLAAAAGTVLALAGMAASLVVCAGLVCLWRDSREAASKSDWYERFANRVPTDSFLSKMGLRLCLGRSARPGDLVRVKTLREIEATLDTNRTLDNLPFMREMESFCGAIFRVHRRIDKINDMRHKTGLRRMQKAVTLTEIRCSGASHGGCQAECQILWKDQWLERLDRRTQTSIARTHETRADAAHERANDADDKIYVCQMTRLWEASQLMSRSDFRQDLRPLMSGNVPLRGFLLAMLTRLFNVVQDLRGGASYPFMPPATVSGPTPTQALDLSFDETATVRAKEEIAATLVNNRNRGLWFDREMIRFCNRSAVVHSRVKRVIHESTGKMVVMKTPSIVLKNVIATGEFLRLCPQHEYIFWREIWLRRAAVDAATRDANR